MGDSQIKSTRGLELLAKVREICTSFPEVEEKIDLFGHTSFRIKDKPFVMMGEKAESSSISIKTSKETQEILLQQGNKFSKTPYIGHHGWVSLRNTDSIDWAEAEGLMKEGFLRTAPKKLVKQIIGE
ncbi:MmcQ/YjbR family DNA-binding protein [Brevibacillus sp. SYSU BS000544]|uniref:MmcQ/YjbR family DNA-binding protein n=1 Tax=Brevibacillus sp. SYSU BS000544 TaxID=3416443 RepID=UPI003CE4D560